MRVDRATSTQVRRDRAGFRVGGRIIGLGIAAVLLAGAIGWEASGGSRTSETVNETDRRSAASLATSDATGSLWFCPLVASTSGLSGASVRLTVEPGRKSPTGGSAVAISLRGPAGVISENKRSVPAGGLIVSILDLVGERNDLNIETLPSIAAVIESSDPAVLVEASLGTKSNGFVPCATTVSQQWFVADGTTLLGTKMELALFNPFPGNALVDLRFWTERGAARPTALQGLVVPGGAIRIVNIGDFVRRRERVAVEIGLRAGRIVPAMNQTRRDRSNLVLATPEASSVWFFPAANGSSAQPEQFTLINPGSEDANVELTATLDPADIEPFQVVVPADSSVVISPTEDGRVPEKTSYAVVAKVISGPEVVLVRTVGATAKSNGSLFGTVASPRAAQRWVAPLGSSPGSVAIFNPYDVATKIIVEVDGKNVAKPFTLGSGAFTVVPVPAASNQVARAVLVRSDSVPVVVSSSQTANGTAAAQIGLASAVTR
jgi:hypothetical protein